MVRADRHLAPASIRRRSRSTAQSTGKSAGNQGQRQRPVHSARGSHQSPPRRRRADRTDRHFGRAGRSQPAARADIRRQLSGHRFRSEAHRPSGAGRCPSRRIGPPGDHGHAVARLARVRLFALRQQARQQAHADHVRKHVGPGAAPADDRCAGENRQFGADVRPDALPRGTGHMDHADRRAGQRTARRAIRSAGSSVTRRANTAPTAAAVASWPSAVHFQGTLQVGDTRRRGRVAAHVRRRPRSTSEAALLAATWADLDRRIASQRAPPDDQARRRPATTLRRSARSITTISAAFASKPRAARSATTSRWPSSAD